MKSPTVFISYSHDTPEHMDRVLALSDQLREEGIDCTVDQYVDSPPEGWPKWMDRQIEDSDFVLVICTEIYCRRVMDKEKPTVGKGVKWESTLTYQDIYDADAKNTKFVPVLLDPNDAEYIPKPLRGVTYYCIDTEEGYEKLYRRLTNQPRVTKPELGKLKALPVRKRKQVYEEHTRELVPLIEFAILSHRCELSDHVNFTLIHHSPILPVPVYVEAEIYLGGKNLGFPRADPDRGYYSGRTAWNMNPLTRCTGHFGLPEEVINSTDEEVSIVAKIRIVDQFGREHERLPIRWNYNRKGKRWIVGP